MAEKWSASYRLVAGAGAEDIISIATVPPGKVLTIKLVHVAFPIDTLGMLDIALYYGNMKVYPNEGHMSGDNMTWVDEVDLKYFSQDPVRLYYKNRDEAAEKKAYIKLEGQCSG